MKGCSGRILIMAVVVALGACTSTASDTGTAVSVEPSAAPVASVSASPAAEPFPIEVFGAISQDRVSRTTAAELQKTLDETGDGAGISVTVMSAAGTWSGTTGKADGVRDLRVDDQFAIASVTKPIIAAQVMQMVEAGELQLDDLAADHLPPDLDFDTNRAAIRDLLSQHSGIPTEDWDEVDELLLPHPRRVWTPAELLELVPAERSPAGGTFEYANANYILLGYVIEHIRGRPVADVLRDGVLNIDGVERLIYQPDEAPTEPMAMPGGRSVAALRKGGGYLPFLASVSSHGGAAAMASDAPSLARWWRALCAGEIVSQASVTEMTTMHHGYGLGLYEPDPPGTVGHGGASSGYVSQAGCMPDPGIVVVVLSNRMIDTSLVAGSLLDTLTTD